MDILTIIGLLIIGWVGFLVFYLLRLPSPTILGAFTIIGLLKIFGVDLPLPPGHFQSVIQILLGLYVGVEITKKVIAQMKQILLPAVLMSVWALSVTLGGGLLLMRVTGMDTLSAFLGVTPGGISETSIIAASVGADVASVSLLQIFRLLVTLVFFPVIARPPNLGAFNFISLEGVTPDTVKRKIVYRWTSFFNRDAYEALKRELSQLGSLRLILTVIAASMGGYLGFYLNLPAGGLLGALILITSLSIGGVNLEAPPMFIKNMMRIGVGVVIGHNFSRETFYGFYDMLAPIIIFTILIFGSSIMMSRIIERMTGWGRGTCVLATAPAGFTSMIAVAQDLECDQLTVSMMQLSRLLTIKCLVPIIIYF